MLSASSNAPHVYIQCDVPDGMTLVEWRRAHSQRKPRRFRSGSSSSASRASASDAGLDREVAGDLLVVGDGL